MQTGEQRIAAEEQRITAEEQQIATAIAALTAQRALLGDSVVDMAVAPLRARLEALRAAPAPETPAPAQTLRQVAILFLDVVGSTALGQRLDPEDIHALMDGALARCTEVVAAHHGKVLQYAGDSLLAVFGADGAREDDSERAVRAGLDLLAEGRRQGEAVRRRYGHDGFDVRVGIHSGGVLLGGGVDAESSIRGIAVNIAARMEQTAPPGTLRISRDTWRQVQELFDAEPQPPLAVKGIDEPIASYLVRRARPRAFRTAADGAIDASVGDGPGGIGTDSGVGAGTGMIGRDAELQRLLRIVDAAQQQRTLRLVTVVADAGMGKSRMLAELERRLERHPAAPLLLHGRARRHGVNVPHGVIRDMLAWHCDILDSDAPAAARAKLLESFGAAFGDRADEQAALVGQLIGLDFSASPHIAGIVRDGRQIQARAFHAIAQYLRLRCCPQGGGARLAVLLLDDLHWADDGSLDCIDHLAGACRDLPLVLGCFARPTLFERRASRGRAAADDAERIDLGPLAEASGASLLDALLARLPEPPPRLRSLILRHAEGNPFHMAELLGMLIDDGVVVPGADGWRVDHDRLGRVRVPPTLIAVLQSRLDSLPPAEKRALQHDSVVGHVFWDEALRQVAPESIDALDALARRDLIHWREASSFAGVREYAFKHHLLHQVTYDTVLRSDKRLLHRRTADWLVTHTGVRIGEHLALVADHYERAGDAADAARYLRRAGEAAYDAAAYAAALDHIDRALALTPEADLRARFDLLALRINVFNATGRRQAQADDLAALERCAEALGDDACRARAARARSLLAVVTGDYAAAIAASGRVRQLAAAAPDQHDPATTLGALLDKGQALIYMGQTAAAQECLESMLPPARLSGRADLECAATNRLNVIAQSHGDYVAARAYLEQALGAARGAANRRFEGALLGNLGLLEMRLGRHDRALELLQTSLDSSRAIGDRGSEPYALIGIAEVVFERGDAAAALTLATEAAELARAVADRGCEADCTLHAGLCHAQLGNLAEASACFDACEDWSRQAAAADAAPPPLLAARAELALTRGRLDEALGIVGRIADWLDARQPGGARDTDDLQRLFVCHRVLAAAASPRAGEFLERARAMLSDQAGKLPEADRAAYLGNVRLHRRIADAAGGGRA